MRFLFAGLAGIVAVQAAPAAACSALPAAIDAALAGGAELTTEVALDWADCDDPLARELALARLADEDAAGANVLAAIVRGLAAPEASVRFAALFATVRQGDAIRPVLLAALPKPGRDGDAAAAALALLGAPDTEIAPLRSGARDDPARARRLLLVRRTKAPGLFKAETSVRPALRSTDIAARIAAAERQCGQKLERIALTPDGLADCPGLSPEDAGLVAQIAMMSPELADAGAFEAMLAWLPGTQATAPYPEFGTMPSDRIVGGPTTGALPTIILPPAKAAAPKPVISVSMPLSFGASEGASDRREGGGPRPVAVDPSRGPGAARRLPAFPWPAPRPMKQQALPDSVFGGAGATLDQVLARLQRGLQTASSGYEWGVFSGPPSGFVLLTRIERIQADGTPFDESRRFTEKGSPKFSFLDMLNGLLGERPGRFRAIAFVVTDNLATSAAVPVSAIPLDRMGEATELPSALGRQKLGDRHVYALVYAFERLPGKPRRAWTVGAPSALQHLQASGIARSLGLR